MPIDSDILLRIESRLTDIASRMNDEPDFVPESMRAIASELGVATCIVSKAASSVLSPEYLGRYKQSVRHHAIKKAVATMRVKRERRRREVLDEIGNGNGYKPAKIGVCDDWAYVFLNEQHRGFFNGSQGRRPDLTYYDNRA